MRLLLLIGSLLLATVTQANQKAADSLKSRLTLFYDCYVTGHFRQADEFVAAESKDAFFNAAKERYRSYEIARIDLKNNENTAEVTLIVATQFMFGGRSAPVKMPIFAHWKKIDGQWFWFAPPQNVPSLPFAVQQKRLDAENADVKRNVPSEFPMPIRPQASMTAFLDKPVLTLSPCNGGRDVTHLRNTSRAAIYFQLEDEPGNGIQFSPHDGLIDPGASQAIEVSLIKAPAANSPRTMHAAYISIRSGIRLQLYVAIEPGSATADGTVSSTNR